MPATLSQLQTIAQPLTVTYKGLTVNVAYAPGKYTPEFEASLNTDEASRAQFLPNLLSELLSDWDILVDESGTKAPITPATLSRLGYGFLNTLATALIKDLSPGEEPARNSGSF